MQLIDGQPWQLESWEECAYFDWLTRRGNRGIALCLDGFLAMATSVGYHTDDWERSPTAS